MSGPKFNTPNTLSESAQERNLGDKRCVRFSVSVSNDYDKKLRQLATSCGKTKAEMADMLLRAALDSPPTVEWFQNRYNKEERYWIRTVWIDGKLHYC